MKIRALLKRTGKVIKIAITYLPEYLENVEAVIKGNRAMMAKAVAMKGGPDLSSIDFRPMQRADEWRRNLREGDVLIMHYGGFWAPVLPSYLNHAAMYVGNGKVIGSDERGVVKDDVTDYDEGLGAIEILRVKGATDEIIRDAVAFVESQLGKRYDVNWYHKSAEPSLKNWYCSELVWAAYWNASMKNLGRPISIARDPGRYDEEKKSWVYDPHAPVSPKDIHENENTDFVSGYAADGKKGKVLVTKR